MDSSVPSVCLIGVTGFGGVHLRDIEEQEKRGLMRLAAVTVVNPDACPDIVARLSARGCGVHADYRAMLDDQRGRCDFCFIPTGPHWHRPMVEEALAAGMNVFVEKPAAVTAQDLRAMRAAENASGRWVAVGFQAIYDWDVLRLKELLLSQRLGRTRSLRMSGLWRRGDGYYARNDWAGRLRAPDGRWVLDSPVNNALAHYYCLPLFLAGARMEETACPTRVEAEMYRARPIESCDTAGLRVHTREGVDVLGWVTHVPDGPANEGPVIHIDCERGRVRWTLDEVRIDADDGLSLCWPGPNAPRDIPLRQVVMDRLRSKWRGGGAFVCGLDIAMAHTAVVNAAHDAARVVDFPAELVERHGGEGDAYTTVKGLSGLIHRATAEGRLFAEMGLPWAAGGAADAEAYFAGDAAFPAKG